MSNMLPADRDIPSRTAWPFPPPMKPSPYPDVRAQGIGQPPVDKPAPAPIWLLVRIGTDAIIVDVGNPPLRRSHGNDRSLIGEPGVWPRLWPIPVRSIASAWALSRSR